ncbi:MAG: type 4a pilus biogenesis protein PilO [Sedimentisphaerales bacterium]
MAKMERKQIVMSVVVIVLAVIFVFLQYMPLNKRAQNLKAANAAILADNAAADAHIGILPQLYKDIENIKKDVGNFDAKIPVGRTHGLFLQDLTSIMQKQGLDKLVVQPGTETETSSLSQIPVFISCEGKLVQIFRFFKALESFERIIQIEEVDLKANNELDGSVVMQAKVNIFYRTN